MIIESVALMTMFDVVMIALALFAVFNYVRYFKALSELKYVGAVTLIVAGVVVLSFTYVLDFATMHVLPIFMSFEKSDHLMNRLYMDWNWWISATGVIMIVSGVAYLSRNLVPHTKKMLSELTSQKQELDHMLDEQRSLEKELRNLKNQLEEKNIAKAIELDRTNKKLEELRLENEKLRETIGSQDDEKKIATDKH